MVDSTSTTTGFQLLGEGHRQAAGRPQLRGHRVLAAGRPGGLRRDAGPVARDLGLRIDVVGEPVPDRRRQHDERHQGLPGQGPQHRVHPGSRSEDGRLPGRVRPQHRRRGQRHHEVGRQRVPRRRVRLLQRHGHARRPEERRRRQLRRAGLLGDGRRAVPEQRPREGRASGVGRRPRRLRHQGQGLVLRRVRPRPGQPEPPDARPDQREHLRQPLPDHVLPEQVLRQADVQHLSGHLDRRQRLLGRADAGGRDRDPDGPLAVPVQRPPRHGRTGLRRAAEPALRLVRHPDVPVRASTTTATAPSPPGLDVPSIRDYTLDPNGVQFQTTGGFGSVFGPTLNNNSKRQLYAGSFTAYVGNHEIKLGGDYQKDTTSGSTYYTGEQRLRIRPCLQTGASVCDLAAAPFYTNSRRRRRSRSSTSTTCWPTARRRATRSSTRRSSPLRPSATAASSRTSGASSRP